MKTVKRALVVLITLLASVPLCAREIKDRNGYIVNIDEKTVSNTNYR